MKASFFGGWRKPKGELAVKGKERWRCSGSPDQSVKRLRSKVFWVIWIILTMAIVLFAVLFVYQTYMREVRFSSREVDMTREILRQEMPELREEKPILGPGQEVLPPRFDEAMRNNQSSLVELVVAVILLEVAAFFLAFSLARRITKPVEDAFAKQKQFVADASHDLKTPIAVIMANCDMLEDDLAGNEWLGNIKNESEHMNALVRELLQLAVSDEEKNYEFRAEDLSAIVLSEVLAFESLAFEHGVELEYEIEPGVNWECDKVMIQQLLNILLDNAINHAAAKSKVKVDFAVNKGKVVLVVGNRGEAIPVEDEEKIFERFYRRDKTRNHDGNHYGLGLAIARKIVENHRGKISAHSEDGWTTFTVVLMKR